MSPTPVHAGVRIGTSGWVYRHWKTVFYPTGLPQRLWFDFYAERFDTVEVNFSFYRLPTVQAFEGWRDKAPPGFCFALKGSRYVTHIRRLAEPGPHLKLFFDRAGPLVDRTGPILWQLPPNFRRDDERLESFLTALPTDHLHTVEFRHESWNHPSVLEPLRRHGIALCIPDRAASSSSIELTTDWTYIRFHQGRGRGGNYTLRQLDQWAERIRDYHAKGVAVWAYFNNDPFGFAVKKQPTSVTASSRPFKRRNPRPQPGVS